MRGCGVRIAGTVLGLSVVWCQHAGAWTPPDTLPPARTLQFQVVEGHDIHFAHISTDQGLSDSAVLEIVQDNQGFMWFGTNDGLNRYDGYEFKVYRRENPNARLSGNDIQGLFRDRDGALWFGADQFLDRLDPVTEALTEYAADPRRPTSLGGVVGGVTQDREGGIWIATSTGLDKLNPATGIFTHYRHNDEDPGSLDAAGIAGQVIWVGRDNSGALWAETSAGLNSFDPETGRATRYSQLQKDAEFQEQHVYQDRSGRLWIYSREGTGIGLFNPLTREFVRYKFIAHDQGVATAERVTSVLEDHRGTIWFGTGGSGLLKFDPIRDTVVRYRNDTSDAQSLSNNFVLTLYEDREGNVWAGTGGGGINRFSSTPSGFRTYRKIAGNKNSLDQNFVLTAFEDSQGILWVANDGVLNRIDPKTGVFRFYRHVENDPGSISDGTVLSAAEDKSGILWFATYRGGLDSFDRKTGRFRSYHHEPGNSDSPGSDVVMRLQPDPSGQIWVAMDHHLDLFDPIRKHFRHFPVLDKALTDLAVTCMTRDRNGVLWLGTTRGGLLRFDPAATRIQFFRNDVHNPTSLSSNQVNALLVDSDGGLWVGTQNGLDRFDPVSQKFHAWAEQDGLPGNAIQGILEDRGGNLWMSSGRGLARLDPHTNLIRNY